jgi:putative ABC transport system permease protein
VTVLRLASASLFRAPLRTLVRIVVLAASIALIGAMLLFVGNSLRTMSGSAVRGVPLDWQGPVSSLAQDKRVAAEVARQPGVQQASATATAPFTGAAHAGRGSVTSAGKGAVLAVPPAYLDHIKTFRLLQGAMRPGAVVLDQQMAATLKAHIGDTVTLTPHARSSPTHFRVSGVAIVTAPDQVFQPLDPQLGPAPAQPPANIAILPLDTFAKQFAPQLGSITPANPGSNVQPGAQNGIQWQVQAQLDPAPLSAGSPGTALKRADHTRNRVERSLPGQVQFVDNLSDSLNTAAGDALYAETLYIMLAVPGALIALGLAYLAALGTVERDRRDLALMRARGATRGDVVKLAGVESAAIGLAAGLLGAGVAFAAVSLVVNGGAHLTLARAALTIAVCILAATAGAAAARFGASRSALAAGVAEAGTGAGRERKPLWQRLYLDVAALAVSGLIYFLTARTGFSAVVNPDSNPTLSLSVYMFFGPALLWLGATLLLVRLRGRAIAAVARVAAGGRARTTRGFLAFTAALLGAAINRGLVVVGLLLAFGVSLGIFSATYDQQANVDAQLTLGADVVATAPPGIAAQRDLAGRIGLTPGVKATTALEHSYAYVGPDLQDTYGIDPGSLTRATSLRDSYFLGGGARTMMSRLQHTRDGILVSRETITDFSLR